MDFYSVVLKKSASYWVALCLENGIVAQGDNPEQSMSKLQEAIESFFSFPGGTREPEKSPRCQVPPSNAILQAPPAILTGGRASYFRSLVPPGNEGNEGKRGGNPVIYEIISTGINPGKS